MLVKQFKTSREELYFIKVSDLYRQLISLSSTSQRLFSLNIQNTFPWLLLIIYTSSAIFVPLPKSFNHKKQNMQTIFAEISGDEIGHIGECSVALQGSIVPINKRGNQLIHFHNLVPSLTSRTQTLPIAVKKQAKTDTKLLFSCPVLRDHSILFQIFCPGLQFEH